MNSHELAKVLLEAPDLPVALHVNNHTYITIADRVTHGPLRVGVLESYAGQHVIIGNFFRHDLNPPNWFVSTVIVG